MAVILPGQAFPGQLLIKVRDSIWAIDKDQPIGDIKMMTQVIGAKGAK